MRLPFLAFTVLFSCADRVQIDADVPTKDPSSAWAKTLNAVSTPDGIDFNKLQEQRADLDRYLAWAGEHGQHTDGWRESKEDKRIAFLLNVHNAAVLHNLLRHGVPSSPDDVKVGVYKWDKAGFYWGSKYRVDSEWSAINHIGFHDAVSRYQEPLLWVALHDGTKDSAPIKWWNRRKLQSRLERAMGKFVNSDRGMVEADGEWSVNPLFVNRADDFVFWTHSEDVCDWMAGHAKGERKQWLESQIGNCTLKARTPDRRTDAIKPAQPTVDD
jgi:hypothetical protein